MSLSSVVETKKRRALFEEGPPLSLARFRFVLSGTNGKARPLLEAYDKPEKSKRAENEAGGQDAVHGTMVK